jgi:UDP-glucose 4-epimerase
LRIRTPLKALVTGGAGFIGSHLVDNLMEKGFNVVVFDNLSSGSIENIKQWIGSKIFTFIHGDLLDKEQVSKAMEDCEIVFHLAANPEVRISSISPETHYQQNVEATFNLLEAVRKYGNIKTFIFTSSSTVYGEPSKIPTPEDYSPLKPISVYGASKLACEALVTAYAYTYGFKAIIYRLANIVGSRSRHGVIYDFIQKLKANPCELEILGDGTQTKSYLHISDCIEAMLLGLEKANSQTEVFNVGSEDQLNVKRIAEIVAEEMGLKNVKFKLTGGVDGGRGWKGDVKNMLLDVDKLRSLGWKPRYKSEDSVKLAVKSILKECL